MLVDGQPEITGRRNSSPAATTPASASRPRSAARLTPEDDRTVRAAGRGHLLSLLATPLRRRPDVLGKTIADQPRSDHHRRRDAARVSTARCRPANRRTSRCRSRTTCAFSRTGPARAQPWYWWIRVMGRLAPGATPAQARASLEPVFQQTAREGWLAGSARQGPA